LPEFLSLRIKEIILQNRGAIEKSLIWDPDIGTKLLNFVKSSLPKSENLLEYIDHEVISFEEGLRIVFILTELSEYSLLDVISMKATLEEREIIEILSQIVAGLLVLHSFQPPIQHRDIKPENILVAKNKYKICDFGSCSQEVIDFR